MEGAITINKVVLKDEFISDFHGCRKMVKTSTVQAAMVNTDQLKDKGAFILGGFREVEVIIFSQSDVRQDFLHSTCLSAWIEGLMQVFGAGQKSLWLAKTLK